MTWDTLSEVASCKVDEIFKKHDIDPEEGIGYVGLFGGQDFIVLDGDFAAQELRALAEIAEYTSGLVDERTASGCLIAYRDPGEQRCSICKRWMDQPGRPDTLNCGGDCRWCMARYGKDPDCIESMDKINPNWRTDRY